MTPMRNPVPAIFAALLAPLAAIAQTDTGPRDDFIRQCSKCHGLAAADIAATGRRKAADLSNAEAKGGATWILGYISNTAPTRTHKLPFKGTDEELQALVDWLLEQKTTD